MKKHRTLIRVMSSTLVLLGAQNALSMSDDGAPRLSTSGGITEIVLEQTWCYGSCPVDKLVLHSDGAAEYTGMENARQTGQFTGKFSSGDFDQLAQWLVTQGYFDLQDSYGFPNADTSSHVIRVRRGNAPKTVTNQSLGRSLQVWGMENVIRAVAADIRWQPILSGIRGHFRPNASISIYPEPQEATPSGMKSVFAVRTDSEGAFEVPLAAGIYGISSGSARDISQTVVVKPDGFTEATLREPEHPNVLRPDASLPFVTPSPPPGDGLYLRARGAPVKWMLKQDQRFYQLGERVEPTILEERIESVSADNTAFRLHLTIPYDAAVNPVSHFLIIDGTAYEPAGSGVKGKELSHLYFAIPSEERARVVAKHFNIPIGYFSKPGYRLQGLSPLPSSTFAPTAAKGCGSRTPGFGLGKVHSVSAIH